MISRDRALDGARRQVGYRHFWSLSILGLALACGGGGGDGETPGDEESEGRPHESAEQCDDGEDNDDDGFTDCDDLDCRAESDECPFAPEPDRSIVSNLSETSKFLYSGPDPVQKDFEEDALDFWRTALIHGKVVDVEGKPLRDVRISVKDQPEYGFTETRFDGRYDMVVNGGGVLVLDFHHEGHVTAQRSVATDWQREHVVADVGLVPQSEQRHRLSVGSGDVVRAEAIEDDYGKRQPFLVFPEWLEAEALLPDGETQPLAELTLRLTQYPFEPATPSVPNGGARFAPGSLPSRGGFSYSIDVSVEEAEELGATSVRFSEPVAYYVENFLGLPSGTQVPLRSYDPSTSEWETMGSGVVVEIVDVQAGLAQLDSDGDGDADDADTLEELGVFRQEREELARRFEPGDTLMRNRVTHFSTLTQIWEVVAGGATAPADMPFTLKQRFDSPLRRGKVLVDERVGREVVDLAGTPYTLVYQGNRSHGHGAAFHVEIPLVGDVVPAGLTDVFVVADIGGRLFPEDPAERRLAPEAGLKQEFLWDGRNSFGQLLQGQQVAEVWIGYGFAGGTLAGIEGVTPEEVEDALPFGLPSTVLWSWQNVLLGMLDSQGFQLGGFGLDVHHAFDPVQQVLYYGDGRQRTASGLHLQIVAVDQSVPASAGLGDTISQLEAPDSMATAADGSVFVSDDGEEGRIWRISPAGDKEVVLGAGAPGAAGTVELLGPQGVALDPTDGTLFVVDWEGLKVLFLRPNGEVGVLLGEDASARIQEPLSDPDGVAVGPNRELYISDANRVLKVNVSSGQLDPEPYLGGVEPGSSPAVLPVMHAEDVPLEQASGIAVDQTTGTVYVASRITHQVWRVEPNRQAFLVAGTGTPGFSGDGGLAVDAELEGPRGLALGRDGSLFIADQENFRIRRVFPSGEITTVAGGGDAFPSSTTPGPNALVNRPDGLAFGPDGSLFAGGGAVDTEQPHLFRLSPAVTGVIGSTEFIVPSDDGREAYRFDQNGRHLETVDVMTGVTRLTFDYDANNLLTSITDTFDVTTTVTRNSSGRASALEGPYGHENKLSYDSDDKLESITAVEGSSEVERARFEYDNSGLVSTAQRGDNSFNYTFDALGRIETTTDATGLTEEYASQSLLAAQRVAVRPSGTSEEDVYERLLVTAQIFDGYSFSDRDTQSASASRLLDRTFSTQLADGVSISGITAASDQWGEQVRIPKEVTLSTASGDQVTQTLTISATGLSSTSLGTVANPLDFDTYETTTEVNGARYQRSYDRATRTLTVTSPEGRQSVTIFNEAGMPERLQTPGEADTVFTYDSNGRIETVAQEADGQVRLTRYEYGSNGEIERVIDPLGQVLSYDYDQTGRRTSITREDDGARTSLGYDVNDNLISLTPPERLEHELVYEAGQHLADYVPPGVAQDASGGFAAGQVRYDFDEFSRPSQITFADGSTLQNQYYQDFNRASQVWINPSTSTSQEVYYLSYDSRDRNLLTSVYGPRNGVLFEHAPPFVERVEFQTESASGQISFTHDAFQRRSELHLLGSAPVSYAYDNDSLLTQAGPLSVTRDPESGEITTTQIDELITSESTNAFGELAAHSVSFGGDELFSQTFEHDPLGRIETLVETNQGVTQTTTYTYDSASRLASVTVNGSTQEFFYDANGNRFPDAALSEASYDAQDRIEVFGEFEFESTSSGDISRRINSGGTEGLELVYGPLGELRRATVVGSGATLAYENDPFGRRVGRRLNGGAPRGWLYDDLRIIAEIDNNAARTDFIYGTHEHVPDLMFKYGTTFYRLITDHLGSVRMVVNVDTGEVIQELEYDAWGKVTFDSNPGFQPFGFAGGLYDPATGLVRFGARDYDPEVGRWTRKDPMRFGGADTNLMAYAGNDPINYVDPSGTSKTQILRKAWRAINGGLRFGKNATLKEVLGHLARGEGIHVPTKQKAVDLAKEYSKMKGGTGKVEIDPGHVRNGRKGFDHVHALGKDGQRLPGHFWFGNISLLVMILDATGDGQLDELDLFEWANPNPFMPLMDYSDECGPYCA